MASGVARRILLFVLGFLLLPFCVAVTRAVGSLIHSIQPESYTTVSPAAWALLIGFVTWVLIYLSTPKPVRTYVLAHELTHALWTVVMGGRVKSMKFTKSGGSVVVSKNNIFITLAPYFFPLYTVLVIGLYYLLSLFFNVEKYELFWLALVGFSWGFHVTFTISTLMAKQTDIGQYGHLLSYAVIYGFNVLEIGLWIVSVSSATLEQFVEAMRDNVVGMWDFLMKLVVSLQ